jgi:CHAT domain-containing protein/Tfp pilus assembly protein PilF
MSRAAAVSAQERTEVVGTLKQGLPLEAELGGGQSRSYQLALEAGQFVRIVVEQRGIDLVAALYAPDGKKVVEVDSPYGAEGPEPIFWVAESAGAYRVELRSPETGAPAGRYEIRLDEMRRSAPSDENLLAAQKLYAEAQGLMEQGTAEASRESLTKFGASLRLWQGAGDREREAAVLDIIGVLHDNMSDKRTALDYYKRSLAILHESGPRVAEGILLSNVGKIYSDLNENQSAVEYYGRALKIQEELGALVNQSITLSNLSQVYDGLGQYDRVLEYSLRALALSRASGHDIEGTILHNIGAAYADLGDLEKSLDYNRQALQIARARGNTRGLGNSLNSIGMAYFRLGDRRRALEYYEQALKVRERTGDRRAASTTLNNLGVTYDALGDKEKALGFYERALALKHEVEDRNGEALVLNNLGRVRHDLGDYRAALEDYRRALEIVRATGDRATEASLLHNVGQSQRSSGISADALESFNESLRLRRLVRDRQGEAETLAALAGLEEERGDLERARMLLKEALDIFESQRARIFSQELRTSYFASVHDFYGETIELLMRLHRQRPAEGYAAEALQLSERARARSLLELLAESSAGIREGIAPALLERERRLRQQINAQATRRDRFARDKGREAQLAEADAELEQLMGELQQTEALIRTGSPRYAALTQPRPLGLGEIQTKLLDPDTLLLEYSLGDARSYLWAATPSTLESFELPPREKIERAAVRVYELMTARNRHPAGETPAQWRARVAEADAAYATAGAELSELLLRPVASLLGNKRLVIVGDGALQYVPFAALPAPSSSGVGTSSPSPPLIVGHEIVNLPSASTLSVLRTEDAGRAPAPKSIAVLADPVFDAGDERVKAGRAPRAATTRDADAASEDLLRAAADIDDLDPSRPLERLSATRWEAEAITAGVPALERLVALDFAASRPTATGAALRQYRVVHFATHAFVNNVHPDLSGIVLSQVDESGQPQDGFLRMIEIFNMRLPADLVVLSACRTGLGKDVKGEGLISLTRAFMYAGAPRVVVSLWSINDRATAELMARFYGEMRGAPARSPAAALRAAQVAMWRDSNWRAPYFWAAFTLMGEWKPPRAR